jgi:hypothetical protein
MEPTEREEVVAGSFQSVVEAELQNPKHSLAREKEVGSRAHDQTLRGYRVGSSAGSGAGVGSFCHCEDISNTESTKRHLGNSGR